MRPDIYILRLAAGGATDSLSRIFYKNLGEVTGQQMVVANRADAGGDGSVKALGVTTKTRSPILPDVSAINKILPVFELTSWAALCGPAKLPPSLVTTLNEYARKVLTDPDIVRKFTDMGAVAWPTSSEEVTKARDLEEQRLLPVIKAAGILPT